jgi:hypothetical protein
MSQMFKEILQSLVLYFIGPPILGWGMLNCIYELADGFGLKLRKDRKLKCWIYLSLILFLLAVLVHTFSSL